MRVFKLFTLFTFVALLLASGASAATETVTTVERVPFDTEVFSECTGEDIDVEGTMVIVSHITTITNDDGALVTVIQHGTLALQNVSGTSAAGERVRYVSTQAQQFNFTNGADTDLTNLNQISVAQGPNNNSYLDFTFHSTVTPDGKFTGFVANVRVGCR